MFLAEVLAINADEKYIDENGAFDISKCGLIAYANGGYYTLDKKVRKIWIFSTKKENKIDRVLKNGGIDIMYEEIKEECGVYGIYTKKPKDKLAPIISVGLSALQHRGEESCRNCNK